MAVEATKQTTEAATRQHNGFRYAPTVTIMNDGNFKPLLRHCLRNLSPENPTSCDFVSSWDTSRVTNCSHLFFEPTYDSQNDWMLFEGAQYFNVNISGWEMKSCTTMKSMWHGASSFNQPLDHWDTTRVTSMSHMFHGAEAFDQDLSMFETKQVTDLRSMFQSASQFSGKGLSSWNVSSVKSFQSMFKHADSFDANIGQWDVARANVFESMFEGAHFFNQDIGDWNVRGATNLKYMFRHARSFNQDLSSWNIQRVDDFTGMFQDAASFHQTLCWALNGTWLVDQLLEGTDGAEVDSKCGQQRQQLWPEQQQNFNHLQRIIVLVGVCLLVCLLVLISQKIYWLLYSKRRKYPRKSLDIEEEEIMFADSTTLGPSDYFDDGTWDTWVADRGMLSMGDKERKGLGDTSLSNDTLEMASLEDAASDLAAMMARQYTTKHLENGTKHDDLWIFSDKEQVDSEGTWC